MPEPIINSIFFSRSDIEALMLSDTGYDARDLIEIEWHSDGGAVVRVRHEPLDPDVLREVRDEYRKLGYAVSLSDD
jgi:hypothetical protein